MEKDVALKEKKEKKNKAFKPVNLLFRDDLVTFHNVLFFLTVGEPVRDISPMLKRTNLRISHEKGSV